MTTASCTRGRSRSPPSSRNVFILDSGLEDTDRILLEGLRKVQDGTQVEVLSFEVLPPRCSPHSSMYHAE